MTKIKKLQEIAQQIDNCLFCKQNKLGKVVPGEGGVDAAVMFIGEAPGRKESESGKPFVGRSGQFLRLLIKEMGLREGEFFLTSSVKYLPREGTPTSSDIKHGRIHLSKQVNVINPIILVLLGSVAVKTVMGEKISVLKQHGKVIERDNKIHFITLHPAAVLRFRKNESLIISDFRKLRKLIDKEKINVQN